MDWIALVHDKKRWRALVNGVTKFGGSKKCRDILDKP
jgi:hypothetical protein